jgi:hypothetical protein
VNYYSFALFALVRIHGLYIDGGLIPIAKLVKDEADFMAVDAYNMYFTLPDHIADPGGQSGCEVNAIGIGGPV